MGCSKQRAERQATKCSSLPVASSLCSLGSVLEGYSVSHETIVILDFGSQYTQLIAKRVRQLGVYCEIHPYNTALTAPIFQRNVKGIILSGSPHSVYEQGAPHCSSDILNYGVPILGICYGFQLISQLLGGKVESSTKREFGGASIKVNDHSNLFEGLPDQCQVWMSHGDHVETLPAEFKVVAQTENAVAAAENIERQIYGLQFHPEVVHTKDGVRILENFVIRICGCRGDWTASSFISAAAEEIKNVVQDKNVLCGLSGGVDSTVAAVIVERAIGARLTCIFVDNGLLRKQEYNSVLNSFAKAGILSKVVGVDARDRFLAAINGIVDPEEKRKIIGRVFIDVFQAEAAKIETADFLVQGTLYPDVIESQSVLGPSALIKSHHNVGGLPEKMKLKLIEPLRNLFKDEVRVVGRELNLPDDLLNRQPFPGPGLAIRILGEVEPSKIRMLQDADAIVREEIVGAGLDKEMWQFFAVLLPIRTVGVMGDLRTYEQVIAVRAVTSQDGMTADWGKIPYPVLERISTRIINEVKGINRIVYDISSKPPSTIEWE